MQRVERLVAAQHALDEVAVAIDEALDGQAHLLLGEAAHFEQPRLELLELFLEMPDALASDEFHPLAEPSGDVVFGELLRRRREDLVGAIALDQLARARRTP